jgi:hypothetical protein
MVTVYAGQRCIGFLLNRGHRGWEALDAREESLGTFANQKAAADLVYAAATDEVPR